jgi:phosphate transport system protein
VVREIFAAYIKKLENDVMSMGEMVIAAVTDSVQALKTGDVPTAKRIIKEDDIINKKRLEIEEKCVNLIALQQPVATDLREIIAILYVITDLERIGDYAEGIGKIVIMLGKEPLIKPLVDIPLMAEKAIDMLKKGLKAFVSRDAKAAKAICKEDDEVDRLHELVHLKLLTCMIEDPKTISRATPLIWAGHNLERMADRVTNICERTVYLVTGTMHEIKVSCY